MARDTLTGSRIREKRIALGLKQADLAKIAGISGSYLNLIEHNRRRIGGKLLLDIATHLDVEPSSLSEGAEAALLSSLREIAAAHSAEEPEGEAAEEFAGRFPGWAEVLHSVAERQRSLEQTVASLTDRMTHDPQLADALHDMLGAVTAIRSTASILAETGEITPEWRDRFYRNINEDAARLAEGSQALVGYLNQGSAEAGETTGKTQQDEIDGFYKARGHWFAALEDVPAGDTERAARAVQEILKQAEEVLTSSSAHSQVRAQLLRYASDAAAAPLEAMLIALSAHGLDVPQLARLLGCDVALVMRRLAGLRPEHLAPVLPLVTDAGLGLAICDSSGTLTFRKALPDFSLPRFGAACPLWGLYQSLSRPMTVLSELVQPAGPNAERFVTYSYAQPLGYAGVNTAPLFEAHMLIVPEAGQTRTPAATVAEGGAAARGAGLIEARLIGSSCRICPRSQCPARREPSILDAGV
jgi:predicted transcriptional regulator/transcriptional regulator with XRE-family HTH domain